MATPRAFHGEKELQERCLEMARQDRPISQKSVALYSQAGFPEELTYLIAMLCKGMEQECAKAFPSRFIKSITPGSDLSSVATEFNAFYGNQADEQVYGDDTYLSEVIVLLTPHLLEQVALVREEISGEQITAKMWSNAQTAIIQTMRLTDWGHSLTGSTTSTGYDLTQSRTYLTAWQAARMAVFYAAITAAQAAYNASASTEEEVWFQTQKATNKEMADKLLQLIRLTRGTVFGVLEPR